MQTELMQRLVFHGHVKGPYTQPTLGEFVRSFFFGESLPVWIRFRTKKELDTLESKVDTRE